MKKILLAVTVALAITSCSQSEEFENPNQKAEINFGTVVKATSRAAVTDNNSFKSFKVSSFIVAADFNFTEALLGSPYMDGVEYTGTKGSWTPTTDQNKYYWPIDKNVQFFGYPKELTLVAPVEGANGSPTLAFTIGENSAAQTDLVVASQNTAKPADGNKVTLDFKHILAKINFSYKPLDSSFTYTISKITITSVKGGKATYTYAADVIDGKWDAGEVVAAGYEYPITVAQDAVDEYYTLDSTNGSLMLLPQDVAGAKIEITYKTTKEINGVVETFFNGAKTVTLPAESKWGVGKNIRYKLSLPIGADEIGIDTDVKDWDVEAPVTPDVDAV